MIPKTLIPADLLELEDLVKTVNPTVSVQFHPNSCHMPAHTDTACYDLPYHAVAMNLEWFSRVHRGLRRHVAVHEAMHSLMPEEWHSERFYAHVDGTCRRFGIQESRQSLQETDLYALRFAMLGIEV